MTALHTRLTALQYHPQVTNWRVP